MIVSLLDLKDDRTYQAGQQKNPFYPGRAIAYDVGLKDASRVENTIKEAAAHRPVRAVFAIAGINGGAVLDRGQDSGELEDTIQTNLPTAHPKRASSPSPR